MSPAPAPLENPTLGSIDSEMVAIFEAHLAEMNQLVAESQARARATPPPAPSSPNARLFVRIKADWSRDTDGDGTPDWLEEVVAADANHPQQALANSFSSDTDQDGTYDGAQLDSDGDGTSDTADASIADAAIYWEKGPVPRYAVFPLPHFQGPSGFEDPIEITDSNVVVFGHDIWQNGDFENVDLYGTDGYPTDILCMNAKGRILGTNVIFDSRSSNQSGAPNPSTLVWWSSPSVKPQPVVVTGGTTTTYPSPVYGVSGFLTDDGLFYAGRTSETDGEFDYFGKSFWTLPIGNSPATFELIPEDVVGAIDRSHFWQFDTSLPNPPTVLTTPFGQYSFENEVREFVPLPDSGLAAIGDKLLIENPNDRGNWMESDELPRVRAMSKQGWAIVPAGSNGGSANSPLERDAVWANGEAALFDIAAPNLPSVWTAGYELVDMTAHGSMLVKKPGNGPADDYAIAVPIVVEDDELATGVDNVSITSTEPGEAVEGKQWIMAPAGTVTNSVVFKTNATMSNPIGLDAPTAEFEPGSLTAAQATIEVNAPQGSNTSDENLKIKFGDQEAITSPVAIKVMKERTVKVWKIASVEASSGQPSKIVEPLIIPSRDELEAHLDKVFKEQLNADIEVTMSPATDGQYHQIEWDIADAYNYEPNADPTFPHQTFVHDGMLNVMGTESPMNMERPSPELWLIHRNLGALDNSTNIHVYLVAADRIVPLRVEANQVTTDAQNDMSLQGVTYRGDRMCFIASKRRSGTDSSGAGATIRGRTTGVIGHEVGHVFVGDGHPGDYSHYTDPSIIGVAPLPGTKHSDRLMYFGNVGSPLQSLDLEDRGKLLVKGEWDEAETWMNQFVDSPEQ